MDPEGARGAARVGGTRCFTLATARTLCPRAGASVPHGSRPPFIPQDYRSLPQTTARSQGRPFIPTAGVVGTGGKLDGLRLPATEVLAKPQGAYVVFAGCSRRRAVSDDRQRTRPRIPAWQPGLSNKRMQLTKLRAAPVLQAEVPPCAPAGRTGGGTASQLIRSVRWTSGVEHATAWPGTTPPDKSGSPAAEQRAYLDCASQESSRSTCEKPAVHRQEAAAHELFRQLGHEGHPSRACS